MNVALQMDVEVNHTEELHAVKNLFVQRHLNIGHLCINIDTHRNQSFECNNCPKAFVSRHYLKLHIKNVHTAPRDLLCSHCGFAYRTLCTLDNHIRFKHKGGDLRKEIQRQLWA